MIAESPFFYILFGSGGIVVALFAAIKFFKKSNKRKDIIKNNSNENNINININIEDKNNKKMSNANSKKNQRSKNNYSGNKAQKSINKKESNPSKKKYEKYDFSSDEFYVNFLAQTEEKKRGRDEIHYQ